MFEAGMEHGGTTDYYFINTGKDYFVYLIQKKFHFVKKSCIRRKAPVVRSTTWLPTAPSLLASESSPISKSRRLTTAFSAVRGRLWSRPPCVCSSRLRQNDTQTPIKIDGYAKLFYVELLEIKRITIFAVRIHLREISSDYDLPNNIFF